MNTISVSCSYRHENADKAAQDGSFLGQNDSLTYYSWKILSKFLEERWISGFLKSSGKGLKSWKKSLVYFSGLQSANCCLVDSLTLYTIYTMATASNHLIRVAYGESNESVGHFVEDCHGYVKTRFHIFGKVNNFTSWSYCVW